MTARTAVDRGEVVAGLKRLRESYLGGSVDSSHVIASMRDWRRDLSAVGLWTLWLHIDDALRDLERGAETSTTALEFSVDRLIGERP